MISLDHLHPINHGRPLLTYINPPHESTPQIALNNGIDLQKCLAYVKEARSKGLKVPVVLMGYYNPFLSYGEQQLMKDCQQVGINGFIVVDLPPEESIRFRDLCASEG